MLLGNEVTHPHYPTAYLVACDSLPSLPISGKKYYIVNTETKHSDQVGHWVALYFHFGKCNFFYPPS